MKIEKKNEHFIKKIKNKNTLKKNGINQTQKKKLKKK